MKQPPLRSFSSTRKPGLALTVLLLAGLAALWLMLPSTVLADSGGFPTPTRTPVPPTSTLTPLPTSTITQTSVPPAQIANTATLAPAGPAISVTEAPTPAPSAAGGALACMPLAIIFILAVVIGATWLLSRRSATEEIIS